MAWGAILSALGGAGSAVAGASKAMAGSGLGKALGGATGGQQGQKGVTSGQGAKAPDISGSGGPVGPTVSGPQITPQLLEDLNNIQMYNSYPGGGSSETPGGWAAQNQNPGGSSPGNHFPAGNYTLLTEEDEEEDGIAGALAGYARAVQSAEDSFGKALGISPELAGQLKEAQANIPPMTGLNAQAQPMQGGGNWTPPTGMQPGPGSGQAPGYAQNQSQMLTDILFGSGNRYFR